MFLLSYEKLRLKLINNNTYINMMHPGRGIFGSDFGTVAFVMAKENIARYIGSYRRLFDMANESSLKVYIPVDVRFDETGRMLPHAIIWEDGTKIRNR